MDAARDVWVGTLNGITVVFDPWLQVSGSRWVVLYAVPHKRLIPYQRAHARSVTHPCEDSELCRSAIEADTAWRRETPESALQAVQADVRHKDDVLAKSSRAWSSCIETSSIIMVAFTEVPPTGWTRRNP